MLINHGYFTYVILITPSSILIRSSPDSVMSLRAQGALSASSPGCCAVCGVPIEEPIVMTKVFFHFHTVVSVYNLPPREAVNPEIISEGDY